MVNGNGRCGQADMKCPNQGTHRIRPGCRSLWLTVRRRTPRPQPSQCPGPRFPSELGPEPTRRVAQDFNPEVAKSCSDRPALAGLGTNAGETSCNATAPSRSVQQNSEGLWPHPGGSCRVQVALETYELLDARPIEAEAVCPRSRRCRCSWRARVWGCPLRCWSLGSAEGHPARPRRPCRPQRWAEPRSCGRGQRQR